MALKGLWCTLASISRLSKELRLRDITVNMERFNTHFCRRFKVPHFSNHKAHLKSFNFLKNRQCIMQCALWVYESQLFSLLSWIQIPSFSFSNHYVFIMPEQELFSASMSNNHGKYSPTTYRCVWIELKLSVSGGAFPRLNYTAGF